MDQGGNLRWCCGSSSSNDWDLHAVVRRFATGSCSGGNRVVTSPGASDESLFSGSGSGSGSGVPRPPPQSQQDEVTDAAALQQLPIGPAGEDFRSVPLPRGRPTTRSKRKKKKSQVSNKEVTRVPMGASPPDPWAWRKYGQKPIKGSPYPRSYYRCSTDKDCRARKQVERCRTDPSTLIVSYTGGEHSHPVPLHRSALAGTTRNKPPQRQPASSASPAEQPPAASSSPQIETSTDPLLLCPSVGVEYEEDDAVAASLLLEDAEMEGEEDALSFLKPTPPSPTNEMEGEEDALSFLKPTPPSPTLLPTAVSASFHFQERRAAAERPMAQGRLLRRP